MPNKPLTRVLNLAGQAREQAFNAELAGQLTQARLNAARAKEDLTRLMGLWGTEVDDFVPDALPALPRLVGGISNIEATALANRVDLRIAHLGLEAQARAFNLTDQTRIVIDLEIVAGAELEREAEATPHTSYAIARHYRDVLVPLRTTAEEEGLRSYNGMIINTFELLADGMIAHLWGYSGQSTGPTTEAVEGDRVRIYVTNKRPEKTSVHWHGLILPSGMDGVTGLSHPGIKPGKTFAYEFDLIKSGTFMYHPHSDEMVQRAVGMMGVFVVYPKAPALMPTDRDFLIMLNAFDIEPGTYVPRIMTMSLVKIK